MPFCSNCGNQLSEETKFCPYCGTSVGAGVVANEADSVQEAGEAIISDADAILNNAAANLDAAANDSINTWLNGGEATPAETTPITGTYNAAPTGSYNAAPAGTYNAAPAGTYSAADQGSYNATPATVTPTYEPPTSTYTAGAASSVASTPAKKKLPIPIIVVAIVIVIAIIAGIGGALGGGGSDSKSDHYQAAQTYLLNEQYAQAREEYKAADDYSDAAAMAAFANDIYGGILWDNRFDTEYLDKIPGDIANYAAGIYLMNRAATDDPDAYIPAAYCFAAANGYGDSNDLAEKCENLWAGIDDGGSTPPSGNDATYFADAEEAYQNGELATAQYYFSMCSSNYSQNGIKVSDRLAELAKYQDFVDLCGDYKAYWGYMENYDYETNDNFNSEASKYGYATITCVIQKDGSVEVRFVGSFTCYANYSGDTWGSQEIKTRLHPTGNENFTNIADVWGSYGDPADKGEITISETGVDYHYLVGDKSGDFSEATYYMVK